MASCPIGTEPHLLRRSSPRPDAPPPGRGAPSPLGHRLVVPAIALAVYAALAVLAYLPVLPLDNGHVPAAKLNDSISIAWFLDWVATAVHHGHDPLVSGYLEHPAGVNLAVNQSMSLAGVLSAPVSWLLGPFAAFNLWLRVAFVASAASMYLVLRRYVAGELPAFLGGLLYGFSPFVVGHNLISPNFSLAAVPPLLFLLVDDLLRRDRATARRDGLLLGALAAVQLYLNPELLAECALCLGFACAIVLPRRIRREGWARARRVAAGLGWALPALGLLGAPFGWAYVLGPQRLHGPVVPLHYLVVFRTDLAGLVVPGINQRLGPPGLIALGTSYTSYAINETGVYLGVPLLAFVVYLAVRLRRRPLAAFASATAGVGLLLSLGPGLVVDDHHTGIWLPWALFLHVPLLQSAEAIRFVLYTYLGVAVLLALGLEDLAGAVARRRERAARASPGVRARRVPPRAAATLAVVGLAAVVLVPLVPRWPYASQPTGIPRYFTSGADRAIPPGAVAMTYPYAQPGTVQAEMWQMASGFRFRLVGGYAYIADNGGVPFGSPPVRPAALTDLLVGADQGAGVAPPAPGRATEAALRAGLRAVGAQVFLLQRVGDRPGLVVRELTAALGRPPVASGGILAWYHVRADLTAAGDGPLTRRAASRRPRPASSGPRTGGGR